MHGGFSASTDMADHELLPEVIITCYMHARMSCVECMESRSPCACDYMLQR